MHAAMDDLAAIRTLNEAYADAVNRRDAAAWGACWAEDASWDLMGTEVSGRPAIVQLWEGAMARFGFVAFFCQPGPIRVAGDRATGTVWTHEVLVALDGTETRPLGRYEDQYLRTADGWRIARREFTLRRA